MKRAFTLLIFSIFALAVSAQRKGEEPKAELATPVQKSFSEILRDDYTQFYQNGGIFEKLYLMTDKPYYSAGETIYFSGHLVHATLFTRISASAFVYAELISPEGRLIERAKIGANRKQFVGTFTLSPRLSSGRYTLRAYTRWMTNFDMGYFFTKEIYIGNHIDDAIHTAVSYQTHDNGTVSAFIRFYDQNALPIVSTPVRYRTIINDKTKNGTARTSKDGTIEIKFRPSEDSNDCFEVNVRANNRDLTRTIPMPSFSNDFDVQFCPEGGNLIGGIVQVLAFKAQGANGRAVAIEGKIFKSDTGEEVSPIASVHDGMGQVILSAEAGVKYHAEVTSSEGLTKRFDLPVAVAEGVSLRVIQGKDYHVVLTQTTPGLNIADFVAVVHSRGAVMTIINDLSRPSRLLNKDLFDGIGQVSIVHRTTRQIVAERLFYVRDNRFAKASISTEKCVFEQRDHVFATLDIKDSDGNPASGSFSVSVTDGSLIKYDESAQNIYSYMLLSSDLKGDVENAGYYFIDDSLERLKHLDLVMMTNGWRRYSLASIIEHKFPRIMYPIEDSPRILGSVFGLFGRVKKPSIVVMNSKTKEFNQFELNEHNNFIISGLDATETNTYLVQALNKKGKDRSVRIEIETENYPVIASTYLRDHFMHPTQYIPDAFLARAKEKYFYEGGERVIDIEEIVILGRKRTSPFFATGNTGSMLHGDLSRFATVYDALATFKELDILGTTITTRKEYSDRSIRAGFSTDDLPGFGGGGDSDEVSDVSITQEIPSMEADMNTPELYVNGNISDINNIDAYDTKYIERLSFVDGRGAHMLGLSAPSGAILMEVSEEGLYNTVATSDSMARVVVRGCQTPVEFYKPKYPTLSDRLTNVQDMRSTITWEPLVRTDNSGRAIISFYTADRSGTYDIIVEGITDEGELCRHHSIIEVKAKSLL